MINDAADKNMFYTKLKEFYSGKLFSNLQILQITILKIFYIIFILLFFHYYFLFFIIFYK